MNRKNRRILTWVLLGLGLVIVALTTVLAFNVPAEIIAGKALGPYHYFSPDSSDSQNAWAGARAWHHGFGHGFGFMPFVGLFWFVAFLFIGGLIFRAFRHRAGFYRHHEETKPNESPEEILRRIFAEGKISEDEYRSRLSVLKE